jgi:hypothetical protein
VSIVYGAGAFVGAANTAADAGGQDYQAVVPAGMPMAVWLYSTDVTLADATGAALPSPAAAVSFQASAGVDQSFTITVTGLVGAQTSAQ